MIHESADFDKKGFLLCISGPSGVGKGLVIHELLARYGTFWNSVSATTRARRGAEVDGEDYYFVSREKFEQMIAQQEILEYDEYCGNYYGTPAGPIRERVEAGRDVILDVTVPGALALKKAMPFAVTVFLIPPTLGELKRRLIERNTDASESVRKRMLTSQQELRECDLFDYVVMNNQLEETLATMGSIIRAEQCRPGRMTEQIMEVLRSEQSGLPGGEIC